MTEDDFKPMTDGDIAPTPADATAEPEPPLKDAAPVEDKGQEPGAPTTVANARQQVKDGAGQVSQQAGDKAMMFAQQGKDRAVGALEQLSKLIEDAAGQVDEKLGGGNGHYVRTAAESVQGFADQLRDRKVDDLIGDARAVIRKSPGAAIGAAAAVGFVVARLVSAGLDQRDA
ncbi:hypothetical protein [Sphingomonas bacterium]|uniref:hypothetical protein n=1 Tax=Sphingomonas bacterium TaxID=1895847 RepID=UPI0015763F7E|nr:hypothetical protein [Sphingomonas bacterium]